MHFRTHVKAANRGKSGQDEYSDGMAEHDAMVGDFLKLIDDLGIANDTIVFYSTDNGPHYNAWPDAGTPLSGARRMYRSHPDGYNMIDYFSGKVKDSPRKEFWYVNDDGQIVAARYQDWKVVFLENRGEQFGVWREPFVELRVPLLFNLRRDPFEKAQHNSNTYNDWFLERVYVLVPIQALAGQFLTSMKDYPPSQTPGAFNLTKIQDQLKRAQ